MAQGVFEIHGVAEFDRLLRQFQRDAQECAAEAVVKVAEQGAVWLRGQTPRVTGETARSIAVQVENPGTLRVSARVVIGAPARLWWGKLADQYPRLDAGFKSWLSSNGTAILEREWIRCLRSRGHQTEGGRT